jgi:hypothetical protein
MAGYDPQLIEGSAQPTLTSSPTANGARSRMSGVSPQAHHGLIGIVLFAVLVLFVLDKAGFRFAVTVGRS